MEPGSVTDLANRVRRVLEGDPRPRDAQIRYAENVADFLTQGNSRVMLAEAATGIGKTRGYLLPAMLHWAETGRQVVVSTHTLTLLRQIAQTEAVKVCDLVEQETGRRPVVATRLGMRNFLARSRVAQVRAAWSPINPGVGKDPEALEALRLLEEWAATGSGKIQEWIETYGELPGGLTAGDVCLLGTCPAGDHAQYRAHRDEAVGADLTIQTHAMTLIQTLREEAPAHTIIIDEADTIPAVAAGMVERQVGAATLTGAAEAADDMGLSVDDLKAAVAAFEFWAESIRPGSREKSLILSPGPVCDGALAHARRIKELLRGFAAQVPRGADVQGVAELRETLGDLARGLSRFVRFTEPDAAAPWRGAAITWPFQANPAFTVATLRPGRLVARLWRKDWGAGGAGKVLLTSATLDAPSDSGTGHDGGRVKFPAFEREIGIWDNEVGGNGLVSPSNLRLEPTKFGSLSFVLADRAVPKPSSEGEDGSFPSDLAWLDHAAGMIRAAMAEGGRVLVLATSYADSRDLAARVEGLTAHERGRRLDDYLGDFRNNEAAALVTPAGWAGLDLPGLVQHLVITRLPIAAPNPLERELLQRVLTARGYGADADRILLTRNLEDARRRLRQGIGRALRDEDDKAKLWIADPRFPLPDALVRGDRRARWSQGKAENFLTFLPAIPWRFRHGRLAPWDDATVHRQAVAEVAEG